MDLHKFENLKTVCAKIKIKEDKISKIYEWKDYLSLHENEVLQSLKQEGVFLETVFLDKQGKDYFLIYFMKCQNLEKAKEAVKKSTLKVDEYHSQFKKEAWVERQELELLVDFINLDI